MEKKICCPFCGKKIYYNIHCLLARSSVHGTNIDLKLFTFWPWSASCSMLVYYFGFQVSLFLLANSRDIEHDVNYLLIINYYYAIYVVFIYLNKFEDDNACFYLHPFGLKCSSRNASFFNSLDQWSWIVLFIVPQRSSKQSA